MKPAKRLLKHLGLPLAALLLGGVARAEPAQVNPEAFRVTQPKATGKLVFKMPKMKKLKLKNGMPVWLVERHELPLVTVEVIVRAGGENTLVTEAGLASMVAGMLDEGTATRSALAIADEAESLGAQLATGASTDAAYVSLNALTEVLDPSLALMADVLLHPKFDDKEFERVRNDRLTDVLEIKDSPRRLVQQLVPAQILGPSDPYGRPSMGTEASLKRMKRDDLAKFYQTYYTADRAALVVVGDVNEKTLLPLLEKHLGGWAASPVKLTDLGKGGHTAYTTSLPDKGVPIELYDKPGAPQTELRIASLGISRTSKDYAAAEVMNNVFGGTFAARLNMNLREKHGYTYGASSRMGYFRDEGMAVAGGGIRANVTKEALAEMEGEIARMGTVPATKQELDLAKNSITLSLAADFQTNGSTAGIYGEILDYHLPVNEYDTLPARIAKVTAKDVARVAGQIYSRDSLTVVAVGDRKTLEPLLSTLGPVHVIDQATWDRLFP